MEQRVAALEAGAAEMKNSLKKIEESVGKVALDVAEVKGRLSNMPSTFQVMSWFIGVAMALCGLVFAIAKLTA